MNLKDKIVGSIISFLAAFFLFMILFVCISKGMIMNKGYLLSVLDDTNYYSEVRDELVLDLKKSAGAAGFEPSIYDDFLQVEDVKKDAIAYINNSFKQKSVEINEEGFKEKLSAHLYQTIKKDNIVMDKEDKQRLDSYIQINANGYKRYVMFPFIQYIVMGVQMMDRILPFAITICIILLLLSLFFLWRMKLKHQHLSLYISSILGGAGWMCAVLPLVILLGGYTHKINLKPKYYYDFFTQYLDGYLWMMSLVGLFFIIIGIINVLLIYKKRIKLNSLK